MERIELISTFPAAFSPILRDFLSFVRLLLSWVYDGPAKLRSESITTTIDLKDFIPASEGNAWVLNGPNVDATNEVNHDNVKVTHRTFEIASSAPSALPRNNEYD